MISVVELDVLYDEIGISLKNERGIYKYDRRAIKESYQ